MEGLWMVYDSEYGLVCVDNYENCLNEYEKCKSFINDLDEFYGNERVILAKLVKDYRTHDTNEPHAQADDPNSEFYKTTYWDMVEDNY
jgi:hypothetical protein